jgi:Protein of unknown function (DUF3572)
MIRESRLNRSVESDPEALAIQALSFLAGRPEELGRFLSLTGIGPASLRQAAADPAFLGGILDFLLQDEPLLLGFAEESGLAPAAVAMARRRLAGASPE